jgi:hypothetical protein
VTERTNSSPAEKESAGRVYLAICVAALGVLALLLLRTGLRQWSFLPIAIALCGLILRSHFVPLATLIVLASLLYTQEPLRQTAGFRFRAFSLPDWVLCGAVLAYFASYYRLLSLLTSAIAAPPRDPRDLERSAQPDNFTDGGHVRTVAPLEVSWLVLSLPIWAFAAQVCLMAVSAITLYLGFRRLNRAEVLTAQGTVLAVLVCGALLASAALIQYIGLQRLSRAQAHLYLQDVLWQETRGEQKRLNQWLAWAKAVATTPVAKASGYSAREDLP